MDRELLLEIGCEEIPASWLPDLTNQIGEVVIAQLTQHLVNGSAADSQLRSQGDLAQFRACGKSSRKNRFQDRFINRIGQRGSADPFQWERLGRHVNLQQLADTSLVERLSEQLSADSLAMCMHACND